MYLSLKLIGNHHLKTDARDTTLFSKIFLCKLNIILNFSILSQTFTRSQFNLYKGQIHTNRSRQDKSCITLFDY